MSIGEQFQLHFSDPALAKFDRNKTRALFGELCRHFWPPNARPGDVVDHDSLHECLIGARVWLSQCLAEKARNYDAMWWKWHLRHAPLRAFDQRHSIVWTATLAIAETAADCFGSAQPTPVRNVDPPYELNSATARRVVEFYLISRLLRSVYGRIMRATVGSKYRVCAEEWLVNCDTPELAELHEAFDRRCEQYSSFLSGMGLSGPMTMDADLRRAAVCVGRIVMADGGPPEIMKLPPTLFGEPPSVPAVPLVYGPSKVSLDDLLVFAADPRIHARSIWTPDAVTLLLTLRFGILHAALIPHGLANLHFAGMLALDDQDPELHVQHLWQDVLGDFPSFVPSDVLPSNGRELVERGRRLQPTLWPMQRGSPWNRIGRIHVLDLVSATQLLGDTMTIQSDAGAQSNARGDAFALECRAYLEQSPWRPRAINPLIGRHLERPDGTEITDIDAAGESGDTCLLVDCKSQRLTGEEIQNPKQFRSQISNSKKYTESWMTKLEYLKQNPKGPNYDLSNYRRIIGVVCTPVPLWPGPEMAKVMAAPGLPFFCSLLELLHWTRGGPGNADTFNVLTRSSAQCPK